MKVMCPNIISSMYAQKRLNERFGFEFLVPQPKKDTKVKKQFRIFNTLIVFEKIRKYNDFEKS